PKVTPSTPEKGTRAVEEQGTDVIDTDGDFGARCADGNKECAYVTWGTGITKGAIQKAYAWRELDRKPPISCHLYPIRTTRYPGFDVLHYDRWHICRDACSFGAELQVPVYKFLKDPLIREYGAEW